MFIARFTRDQQLEMERLRATVMELRVAIASKDSTNDWLMVRVNSLEAERAELTAKLFNVHYPPPIIERVGERPAGAVPGIHGRPMDDGSPSNFIVPTHLTNAMRHPAMTNGPVSNGRPAEDEVANSIGAHQVSSTSFEDMGDEAAVAAGIQHDDGGNAIFSR